jgi:hypothetical protein
MAQEIERKFLVKGDAWRALARGTTYRQGYLNSAKEQNESRCRLTTIVRRRCAPPRRNARCRAGNAGARDGAADE